MITVIDVEKVNDIRDIGNIRMEVTELCGSTVMRH